MFAPRPVRPSHGLTALLSAGIRRVVLAMLALAHAVAIAAPSYAKPAAVVHVVSKGQTLGSIAKRHRTTVAALREANNLKPGGRIHPGLVLVIPEKGKEAEAAKQAAMLRAERERGRDKTMKEGRDAREPAKRDDKRGGAPPSRGASTTSTADGGKADARKGGPRTADARKVETGKAGARKKAEAAKPSARDDARKADPRRADAHKGDPKKGDAKRGDARRADARKGDAKKGDARKAPAAIDASAKSKRLRDYAAKPKHPGRVRFVRGNERTDIVIVTRRGQLVPAALGALSRVLRHDASGAKVPVDPRLATLLANVSDRFGGRPIRVVSGYRPRTPDQYTPHSNHNLGRAIDFSIEGVPNEVVRDYCRTLRNVGVGYYPNSTFVHLDVRSAKAYWVDVSGPGEAPRYTEGGLSRTRSAPDHGSSDTPPHPPQVLDDPTETAAPAIEQQDAAPEGGADDPPSNEPEADDAD